MKKDIIANEAYWNKFYKSGFKHIPSQFCVCVVTEIDPNSVIVELGCGNGRDALYFASHGLQVVAGDLSQEGIAVCRKEADKLALTHAEFVQADISSNQDIKHLVSRARQRASGAPLVFYSRFVLHSITTEQELALISGLSESMGNNEVVYFEFRTEEDEKLLKYYGGHYRRYVNLENFKKILTARGFIIKYAIAGQGMAKFKEEDPYIARVIAQRI